jgi:DNA-binding NarL/FixJ family response regulator
MPSRITLSDLVRVLIVDDNDAMLARASAVLARGCSVVGAVKDGQAALDAAVRLHPDVIVLDISMHGMSGFEVASRLRESGSTAALVFLTVHDEEEFVTVARSVGGTGYVTKPRLASDLMHAVLEAREGRPFISTKG